MSDLTTTAHDAPESATGPAPAASSDGARPAGDVTASVDPNVTERLAKLVASLARVSTAPEDITETTSLLDDLDIDSILLVELIVNIETEFGIEMLDEDVHIERMIHFGALARTVARRVAGS